MKLYVIVRKDLPSPGAMIAQACHALRAFVATHPAIDRAWYEESNNLVVLQAASEEELRKLEAVAAVRKVEYAMFTEPDYEDQATALALAPNGKALVRHLPLALAT